MKSLPIMPSRSCPKRAARWPIGTARVTGCEYRSNSGSAQVAPFTNEPLSVAAPAPPTGILPARLNPSSQGYLGMQEAELVAFTEQKRQRPQFIDLALQDDVPRDQLKWICPGLLAGDSEGGVGLLICARTKTRRGFIKNRHSKESCG